MYKTNFPCSGSPHVTESPKLDLVYKIKKGTCNLEGARGKTQERERNNRMRGSNSCSCCCTHKEGRYEKMVTQGYKEANLEAGQGIKPKEKIHLERKSAH